MIISVLLQSFIVLLLNTIFFYGLACFLKDLRILDIHWFLGVILVAFFTLFEFDVYELKSFLVLVVVSIWFLLHFGRLIFLHRLRKESYIFHNIKKGWLKWFYVRLFFQIFFVQTILQLMMLLPIMFVNITPGQSLNDLDFIAIILFFLGFALIMYGDISLYRVLKIVKVQQAKLKDEIGLVPNGIIAGEICLWSSLGLLGMFAPYGFFSLISPITLIGILLFFPERYKPLRFIDYPLDRSQN
jgi:steroid 5-alpha reductase family enzyme